MCFKTKIRSVFVQVSDLELNTEEFFFIKQTNGHKKKCFDSALDSALVQGKLCASHI